MISIESLPKIIELSEYGGNYPSYIDAVYDIFYNDFIARKAKFGSHELKMKCNPRIRDKEYTFYHMTHKGKEESKRIPDLRRCERIGWARPVVEKVVQWNLKFWRQKRQRSKNRVCIQLSAFDKFDSSNNCDYFVILEVRNKYVLLWTAFVSEYPHETRKKEKEYQSWLQNEGETGFTPDELIALIQADIIKKQETT